MPTGSDRKTRWNICRKKSMECPWKIWRNTLSIPGGGTRGRPVLDHGGYGMGNRTFNREDDTSKNIVIQINGKERHIVRYRTQKTDQKKNKENIL